MDNQLTIDEVAEFLQGMRDCDEGLPHEDDKGEHHERGYAAQYQLEQNKSHETRAH